VVAVFGDAETDIRLKKVCFDRRLRAGIQKSSPGLLRFRPIVTFFVAPEVKEVLGIYYRSLREQAALHGGAMSVFWSEVPSGT